MVDVLVVTATRMEQDSIRGAVEDSHEHTEAGRRWLTGRIGQRQALLVETGLGTVNTAHAITCVLQAQRPGLLLQVGVGGAYAGAKMELGDLALASAENYGDLGVRTAAGWRPATVIGIPILEHDGVEYYNRFPADHCLARQAELILERELKGDDLRIRVGPFVTVQECSGVAELGAEREAAFEAICENMEGAAAAHMACLYGVPFLELRGISNQVQDRRRDLWDLPLAAARAQAGALALIRQIDL
jgi:futalosine hydrolase